MKIRRRVRISMQSSHPSKRLLWKYNFFVMGRMSFFPRNITSYEWGHPMIESIVFGKSTVEYQSRLGMHQRNKWLNHIFQLFALQKCEVAIIFYFKEIVVCIVPPKMGLLLLKKLAVIWLVSKCPFSRKLLCDTPSPCAWILVDHTKLFTTFLA